MELEGLVPVADFAVDVSHCCWRVGCADLGVHCSQPLLLVLVGVKNACLVVEESYLLLVVVWGCFKYNF